MFASLLSGMNANAILPIVGSILATVVAGVLSMLLVSVRTWFHVSTSAQQQANYDAQLQLALQAAVNRALPSIAISGWSGANLKSAIVESALTSVLANAKETLAGVGVVPDSSAITQQILTGALAARLPAVMAEVAASPATPPVPGPGASATPVPFEINRG
jgi:hypothetical protein